MNFEAVLLTPRGSGAVATIRFCGAAELLDSHALFRAANGRPVTEQVVSAIVYGHWQSHPDPDGSIVTEDVVLTRNTASELEVHCHGGEAAVARILNDLRAIGCEIPNVRDHLIRRDGHFAWEMHDILTRAPTLRTAGILLEQSSGLLKSCLERVGAIEWTGSGKEAAACELSELLRWGRFGQQLTEPWSVVITGRPNVGKSTLMNALMGYTRSVVYDEPGTTRDVVTASAALNGWPVELIDTAGLRSTASGLEAEGITRARATLATADCRVIVVDASTGLDTSDQSLIEEWPDALVVANKTDLTASQVSATIRPDALPVSAKYERGIGEVADAIAAQLVPVCPARETPIPVSIRQRDLLNLAFAALKADAEAEFRSLMSEILS